MRSGSERGSKQKRTNSLPLSLYRFYLYVHSRLPRKRKSSQRTLARAARLSRRSRPTRFVHSSLACILQLCCLSKYTCCTYDAGYNLCTVYLCANDRCQEFRLPVLFSRVRVCHVCDTTILYHINHLIKQYKQHIHGAIPFIGLYDLFAMH